MLAIPIVTYAFTPGPGQVSSALRLNGVRPGVSIAHAKPSVRTTNAMRDAIVAVVLLVLVIFISTAALRDRNEPRAAPRIAAVPKKLEYSRDPRVVAVAVQNALLGLPRSPNGLPLKVPLTERAENDLAGIPLPYAREYVNFMLGFSAHLDTCAGPSLRRGAIWYKLHWRVDVEEHLAYPDRYEPESIETVFTPEQVRVFNDCAVAYFSTAEPLYVPEVEDSFQIWGLQTNFPIHENKAYKRYGFTAE